ncbi:MAG: HD domain-containing protein [Anaerolineae bacterium]|jgi:putative nucleotidyltransferase with HDIG domain
MRKRLLELVPEFTMIQDEDLREKTIVVWETAMERGGWTPDALAQMPFTLLINPCPASYIEHVRAVTLTAYRAALLFDEICGDRVPINLDYLLSGGLLHDIGKLLEYENGQDGMTIQTDYGKLIRHPLSGTALAYEFGLPMEIQHMIAGHAGEGDKIKRSPEGTLINKADFMSFETLRDLQSKKELAAQLA